MTATTEPLVAAVELGGTKCIAVLARGSKIVKRQQWPTERPDATLPSISRALWSWHRDQGIAALGIASFGPIDLGPDSPTYGHMLATPKAGWSGVDVRSALSVGLDVPVGVETDVGGAAMAEGCWGASIGCDTHVYLTVGTGIGAGVVVNGSPIHGSLHPEIGHARVRRYSGDEFAGICPFHGDCLEGLVSGPAISARAGAPVESMAADHPLWDDVAGELAELVELLRLALAPQRIVIGGGVVDRQPALLRRIIARAEQLASGYPSPERAADLRNLVVPPGLGRDAGPLGAVAIGLRALAAGPASR